MEMEEVWRKRMWQLCLFARLETFAVRTRQPHRRS
jgi:hypothetical protein